MEEEFDRGEDCMQRHLYIHFQLPGHTGFLQDTYVTLIDQTYPRHSLSVNNTGVTTLRQ